MGKFLTGDRVRCLRPDRHLSLSDGALDAYPGDLLLVTDGCGHGVFTATLGGRDGVFWDDNFELAIDFERGIDRSDRRGPMQPNHPCAC